MRNVPALRTIYGLGTKHINKLMLYLYYRVLIKTNLDQPRCALSEIEAMNLAFQFWISSDCPSDTSKKCLRALFCELCPCKRVKRCIHALTRKELILAAKHKEGHILSFLKDVDFVSWINKINVTEEPRTIIAGYRGASSLNRYPVDELKSGLQKYIRRDETQKALMCAVELDLFVYADKGEAIRTNMLHRLMIIYLEDIGTANVGLWKTLDDKIFKLFSLRSKRVEDTSLFASTRAKEVRLICSVVSKLSESSHSRLISHRQTAFKEPTSLALTVAKTYYPKLYKNLRSLKNFKASPTFHVTLLEAEESIRATADAVVDLLQRRDCRCIYYAALIEGDNKVLGRRYGHRKSGYLLFVLLEETLKREVQSDIDEESKELAERVLSMIELAVRWYSEILPLGESSLCWKYLYIMWIDGLYESKTSTLSTTPYLAYGKNISGLIYPIDDYAIDMHTRRGKKTKGPMSFALEGSLVNNESIVTIEIYRDFYIDMRTAMEKGIDGLKEIKNLPISEENEYSFLLRTQLNTSAHHTDTYFARETRTSNLVFVKGPYPSDKANMVETAVALSKLRKELGLRSVRSKLVMAVPSASIITPLGVRNRLIQEDAAKEYPYLVTNIACALPQPIPFKIMTSKVWPETKVIDWKTIKDCRHVNLLDLDSSSLVAHEYLVNMMFRYVMGIVDPSDRNFLVIKERYVLGVDEDVWGKEVKIEALSKAKKEAIKKILEDMKDVDSLLKRWRQIISKSNNVPAEIKEFAVKKIGHVITTFSSL